MHRICLFYSDFVLYLNSIQFLINIHLSKGLLSQQFEITNTIYGCLVLQAISNDIEEST